LQTLDKSSTLAIAAMKRRRFLLQFPNGSGRLNAMVRRESVKGISNANEPDWLMEQIAQYRGGLHPSRTQHHRPGGHRTVSWVIRTRPSSLDSLK